MNQGELRLDVLEDLRQIDLEPLTAGGKNLRVCPLPGAVMSLLPILLCAAHARPAVEIYAITDVPVMVGAGVGIETPQRIRVDLSGGMLPGPYWDMVNWAMVTFDVYGETTAELINVLLQGSLVMRAEAGWRPWESRGFFFTAGYQYLGLAGDTTDLSLYAEGIDEAVLDAAQDSGGQLDVTVRPHMIMARVGHEWTLREQLTLRGTLGFAYTLRSNSEVSFTQEAATPIGASAQDAMGSAAEDYLDDIFTSWVHVPMIGISGGYRF
ncbi:MAG: hypothetical protein ACI8RZ_007584 [Myxococcota bacterium]|jgi:hypothetical protein